MDVFPPEGADKLGLNKVLTRLIQHLSGEESRSRLNDYLRFESLDSVKSELDAVGELQLCLQFDDPFHLGTLPEVTTALSKAPPAGIALDGVELLEIGTLVRIADRTVRFFDVRKEKYPLIQSLLDGIEAESLPSAQIFQVIDESGEIKDDATPELSRIRRQLVNSRNRARQAAADALKRASSAGFAADDQPTIRAGRVVIPVRAEAKRKIDGFVHDVSSSGQTVFIEPASSLEANNQVRELELEDVRECHSIKVALTDEVRSVLPELQDINGRLVRLDVTLAKAKLANETGGQIPEVGDEGIIDIKDGRNPALMLVFRSDGSGREVIPFSINLGIEHFVVIISGPNAGGKSVTMKAIGLMATMVGMGIPIPVAEKSRFDLFDGVFVDIGDEQSMADDLSTFTSHLKTLGHILHHAGSNSLVLIDEAGTGTDPEAGGALAQAVFEALLVGGVRTIATTHYGPLKVFAHEKDGIENASMTFDQRELRPTFEFNLGVPGSSYAREIAARSGLPDRVIERSTELTEKGHASAEQLIQDLMNRNQELEQLFRETESMRAELSDKRNVFNQRLESLQEERDRIKEEALSAADEIVRDANRAVEKTIREIKESGAEKEITKKAREHLASAKEDLEKEATRTRKKRRSKASKKRRSSEVPGAPEARSGPIKVGDQVRMDDGRTVGEVLELKGNKALVAFASLQMKTDMRKLVKVGGKTPQEVRIKKSTSASGELSVHSVSTRLDIRGRRVDEALSEIIPFIDRAMAAGVARAEVVHGKGTGALRSVLHEYLDTNASVARYEEAPLSEGGAGVTLVLFA